LASIAPLDLRVFLRQVVEVLATPILPRYLGCAPHPLADGVNQRQRNQQPFAT
jgi:hypothetical protein